MIMSSISRILRVGDIFIAINALDRMTRGNIFPANTDLCIGICIGRFAIGFSLCVGKGEGYDGFCIYAGFFRIVIATMGRGWFSKAKREGYKIPFFSMRKYEAET